jgi:alginate O-acetyltransferase complex protein AlgI
MDMERINRLTTIFGFDFDQVNPLIFTQLNFWFFFLAVIGVYVLIDLPNKIKSYLAAFFCLLGLVFFQYYDTALLLLIGVVNAYYYVFQEIQTKQNKIGLWVLNGLFVAYVAYKLFFDKFYLGINYLDFWLLFLATIFLFARAKQHFLVRSIFLAAVSIFFYYKSSGLYVCLLSLSLLLNFFMGRWIEKTPKEISKKWIIALTVLVNVLVLAYFK